MLGYDSTVCCALALLSFVWCSACGGDAQTSAGDVTGATQIPPVSSEMSSPGATPTGAEEDTPPAITGTAPTAAVTDTPTPTSQPTAVVPTNMPATAAPPDVPVSTCMPWPSSTSTESLSDTMEVSGTLDAQFTRFVGAGALGSAGQAEGQDALILLRDGAVLRNAIIGAPAADGIHCEGTCTLENVWWEDVGEDAATFDANSANASMLIDCGGARQADDKIFQHNGPGTMTIRNFVAENFGKLYRSCGNCADQFERHVVVEGISATSGDSLVGINENYGDTATLSNLALDGDITVCERYQGNDTGAEPTKTGSGPDTEHCFYEPADVEQL